MSVVVNIQFEDFGGTFQEDGVISLIIVEGSLEPVEEVASLVVVFLSGCGNFGCFRESLHFSDREEGVQETVTIVGDGAQEMSAFALSFRKSRTHSVHEFTILCEEGVLEGCATWGGREA